MPRILIPIFCELMFLVHGWLVLGHRQKMGADPKDNPQDPLYTKNQERLSFLFVMLVQSLAIYRRILIAYGVWADDSFVHQFLGFLPLPANDFTFIAGVVIFSLGVALRVWAVRLLGRLFTFEIGIRPEHKIIEDGPYKYIRHPSYTGYALMLLGMAIAFASAFFLIVTLGATLMFFYLRMNSEEKMLTRHFGSQYEEYMRRTKRLIPFIY